MRRRVIPVLKRLVFAIVPLVLLLVAATLLLRWLENRGDIDTVRPDDRVAYPAVNVVKRVDTAQGVRYEINGRLFTARKAPGAFRAFITGGSFARGEPYLAEVYGGAAAPGSTAKWLEADLQTRFPSRSIEIINAGQGGANSELVSTIVEDLLALDPDVVIVASGNNEGFLPKTPFNAELHKWIVYRALKKTLLSEPDRAARPAVAPQDPDAKAIEAKYQENIGRMISLAEEKHVPLALATMPINLRYRGEGTRDGGVFVPMPTDDPDLARGHQLRGQEKYREAIAAYAKSKRQDWATRYIAVCLEELGEFEQAREMYRMHVQQFPLGRTRPSFNEFLRRAAQRPGVTLVDLERAVDDQYPHRIPDPRLFLDYCHMNWRGYQMIARVIADRLIESGLIHGEKGEPGPAPTIEEMIAAHHWEKLYKMQ